MKPAELWRTRYVQYWKEQLPNFVYAIRSGLGAAILLLFLVGTYFYAKLLDSPPLSFSIVPIAIVVLLPFIAHSPVRTMLREADTIFLLPNETELNPYFHIGKRMAFLQQAILVIAVWFVGWPLYRIVEQAEMVTFYINAASLVGLKLFTLIAGWKERQLRDAPWRNIFALLRWAMTAFMLFTLFQFQAIYAIPFIVLLMALYAALLRFPIAYRLHWNELIEREQATRGRVSRFLAWFVDVPSISNRPRRRAWLDRLPKAVPFSADHSYTYLYFVIFLRSEWFIIAARLSIFGALIIALLQDDAVKASVFIAIGWLTAVQLSALDQAHKHSDWFHVYPLPSQLRADSLVRLNFVVHVVGMLPPMLAALFTMKAPLSIVLSFIILAGSAIYHFILLRRKWRRDAL